MSERATTCRSCGSTGLRPFLSLGKMPLPDAFLRADQLDEPELRVPLDVAFCEDCTLVQILDEVPPEKLFVENYLYFSSFSDDLLRHSREHAEQLIADRGLDGSSFVVELASNDGYLLRNFVDHGVPVLGIDPAPQPAAAAIANGVPTLQDFFGVEVARRLVAEGKVADVIIANNVMAHVPDLNGFVAGMATLLADDGVITVENPYVRELIDRRAFDTIYHEHFCYYSCTAVDALARRHGLFLNHVEYFPDLHAGTLRWHLGKREEPSAEVLRYLADERELGLDTLDYYRDFGRIVDETRNQLRDLVQDLRASGATVAAYGAAAKGTILLNAVGLGPELIDFVVDRNVHKQGMYMPGMHIPIRAPEALLEDRPDYVVLLAWNFRDEIVRQQQAYLDAGGAFVAPLPEPEIVR